MKKRFNIILPSVFVGLTAIGLVPLIIVNGLFGPGADGLVADTLSKVSLVVVGVSALLAFVNVIYSIFSIRSDVVASYKAIMILKIILFPCYVLVLVLVLVLTTVFLIVMNHSNAGIVMLSGLLLIMLYVMSTTLTNLASVIRDAKAGGLKVDSNVVVSLVLQFLFLFDIIGSIVLYVTVKKQQKDRALYFSTETKNSDLQ